MTDPRFRDPRYNDPRLSDPVLRQNDSIGGPWGWIAGMAVVIVIGFVLIAGWHGGANTASNNSPSLATGSTPMHTMTPPSTTGSGTTSPRPLTPMTPLPPKSSTQ